MPWFAIVTKPADNGGLPIQIVQMQVEEHSRAPHCEALINRAQTVETQPTVAQTHYYHSHHIDDSPSITSVVVSAPREHRRRSVHYVTAEDATPQAACNANVRLRKHHHHSHGIYREYYTLEGATASHSDDVIPPIPPCYYHPHVRPLKTEEDSAKRRSLPEEAFSGRYYQVELKPAKSGQNLCDAEAMAVIEQLDKSLTDVLDVPEQQQQGRQQLYRHSSYQQSSYQKQDDQQPSSQGTCHESSQQPSSESSYQPIQPSYQQSSQSSYQQSSHSSYQQSSQPSYQRSSQQQDNLIEEVYVPTTTKYHQTFPQATTVITIKGHSHSDNHHHHHNEHYHHDQTSKDAETNTDFEDVFEEVNHESEQFRQDGTVKHEDTEYRQDGIVRRRERPKPAEEKRVSRVSWRSLVNMNPANEKVNVSRARSSSPPKNGHHEPLKVRNTWNPPQIYTPVYQERYQERPVDIGELENVTPTKTCTDKQRNDNKTRGGRQNGESTKNKHEPKIIKTTMKDKKEILNNQATLNSNKLNNQESNNARELEIPPPPTESPSPSPSPTVNDNSYNLDAAVVATHSSINEVDPRLATHHQGHFVVVAIDFGTTFSGYAFSFTRDPDNIHMMRKWEGGDPGLINQKTPTCLLLTPEGEFHSFGFTARDYFHDLDAQEAKKWLYFDKFKMTLHHNTQLNRETKLQAANGKEMSALTVFAFALRYFKNHALMELSDQSATKILNEDVRWVITVPAIWRQPAKQFMRQAAYESGLASSEYPDQLLIALEPEAASIYCRKLRMNQLVPEGPGVSRFSLVPPKPTIEENTVPAIEDIQQGTSYIVVDCGGGTVDITVHEMTDRTGTLKELYKATGGPFGSVGVDVEFEKLLIDIFGKDFIEQFKLKRSAAYVELMIAFEARKRSASPYKNNPLNISLSFSFIEYYRKYRGSSVETAIKKYGRRDIRWSDQGMLRLEPEAMAHLFHPVVQQIVGHIRGVVDKVDARSIRYLFLVGGFAESQILQHHVRQVFGSQFRVIIPQGVSLAILRGAVLFGLDPTVVTVRRSRMTYGVGVLNRFVQGLHPKQKLIRRDGQEWCADVFDKFVLTDQSVGLGDTILRSYTPANAKQKQIIMHTYCSENDQVKFVTDDGVKRCGTLQLDLPEVEPSLQSKRREIQMRMIFGDTEVKVTALDVATKKFVRAEIDFLNL